MSRKNIPLSLLALMICSPSFAKFIVSGPVEGTVCKGFVVQMCGPKTISAFEWNGRITPIDQMVLSRVSTHNDKSRICTLQIKSGISITESVARGSSIPTFYERGPNGLQKVDVDTLRFPCVEVN